MRPRHIGLFLAVTLASTATVGAAQAGSSGPVLPSKSPFYRYHGAKPLAKIRPGTVLKTRTVSVSLPGIATPLTADQLLYRTTDELGKPSVTVTTVLQPPTASVSPQIVGYLSFYDALGSECDPSYTLAGGNPGADNAEQVKLEDGLIAQYLLAGDIVTVPDFEGTKLHWAAGQESGYGTLDGIRATESDLKLGTSTKVGLSGYSGGSIAAEWASELAPKYAPKLNLVGVAEGGIPVDLAHNTKYVNGSQSWSGTIPAVLVSLTRSFHIGLRHFLSPYGKKITHQVHNECIGSFLGSYPGLKLSKVLKPRYAHFLRVPAFVRIINTIEMGTAPGHPKGPLFMGVGSGTAGPRGVGTGDGVMVTRDVEALAHEYCKQHVPLQFTVYANSDHDAAALKFEPGATEFLASRFAGAPFSNGCASVGKGNSLKPLPTPKKH